MQPAGGGDVITTDDADGGVTAAGQELAYLYDSRVDDLPPTQHAYLVAAASLEDDVRTSAAVAEVLGTTTTQVGSYRSRLLDTGLLRTGRAGTIQFTLPGLRDHLHPA